MAKNSLSNLRKQSFSKPTSLVRSGPGSSETIVAASSTDDLRRETDSTQETDHTIAFGKPSNSKSSSSTSSSGSEWATLLKQTASGGIASALSGSFGLGSIGGIGSIVSGIMSLFGGGNSKKATLTPLPEFSLPQQSIQTEYVNSTGSSTNQDTSTPSPNAATSALGLYNVSQPTISALSESNYYGTSQATASTPSANKASSGNQSNQSGPFEANGDWIQEQSAQIAQAVKTALLNSSSLNDVIAEI